MDSADNCEGRRYARNGWREVTLVSQENFKTHPMVARHWVFESGARGLEKVHEDVHQLLSLGHSGK